MHFSGKKSSIKSHSELKGHVGLQGHSQLKGHSALKGHSEIKGQIKEQNYLTISFTWQKYVYTCAFFAFSKTSLMQTVFDQSNNLDICVFLEIRKMHVIPLFMTKLSPFA